MKTPICTFDAKTRVLCTKCETQLRQGDLTNADIEGAIKITKLAERSQDVNKFTMTGASKVDDDFVLMLNSSDISLLRTNSALSKRFEDEFQSKVWFVDSATDRGFLESLFFPAKVLTVNLIWLPDGSKLTKVKVSARNKSSAELRQQSNIEKIIKIAKEIRGIELLVESEGQN